MNLRVYLGFDERLQAQWDVAAKSARRFGCEVIQLRESTLRMHGLLTRPVDRRGQMYDFNSGAPQATDFAVARFAVHILAHSGWCLFADSDALFLEDPHSLLSLCDPTKAVMVVKHLHPGGQGMVDYRHPKKMDGQAQTNYYRKNWSSVALWNCDHPGNLRLNLMMLNQWPGRDLHAFKWLADSEIGDLPMEANWLVGLQPKPERPIIAHFTLGTPDMPGLEHCEHAELWQREAAA